MTDREYFYKLLTLRDETAPITRDGTVPLNAVNGYEYMISVFPEPLRTPAFHVTKYGQWEVVLSIRGWKVLRTMNKKFKAGRRIPPALEKRIKAYLAVEMGDTGKTKWEWLLMAWDQENPGRELGEKVGMPE